MKSRPNEELQRREGDVSEDELTGIAIVGMSGRYPEAPNLDVFWESLRAGHESIHRMSDAQLQDVELDFEKIKDDPAYVRARGILEDVDLFDAKFFGYSPREASILDPQQRLWLECSWEALEEAGVAPGKYPGSIGVYAGSYVNTYLLYNLCKDRDYIERLVRFRAVDAFQSIISNDKDYLPTRTAYKFDLKGPAVTVQTACSTSLVAVAMACSSLANYESDVCLAGGVCVTLPQEKGYLYQEGGMNSPDGHCRSFDADAQGTVFSSGLGVVVLKRLEDAIADGDSIRAVIRGWATNNDGAIKMSFPAPSVDGQAEVIALAQGVAGVDPETITYVEAHGTATPLGDPIEVEGLTKAFRAKTDKRQFCGLGSVKTNVGHMDAAAGVTGLIKTVLAMEHREIPANLHYQRPNPEIDFDSSPFYVVDRLTPWNPEGGLPRRAGVSSFGVGGTNAHVVLEEAPEPEPSGNSRPWQLLPLSAKTDTALDAMAARLADHLEQNPRTPIADTAFTLQVGRPDLPRRRFAVCRDAEHGAELLRGKASPLVVSQPAGEGDPSLVFMFPGQGAQHVDMGLELYEHEPVFREALDRCAELLRGHLDLDIRTILYPGSGERQREEANRVLKQTGITQPALFSVQYALAQLWISWGFEPAAMVGHSVGEFTAACIAGVFSLEGALQVLSTRARLMEEMPGGSMRAIRLSEEEVQRYLGDGVALAACNAPAISVVSGSDEAIARLDARLEADGLESHVLHTSHAFHSEMMEPVLEPFAAAVQAVDRHAPRIPIVSTHTGTWLEDSEAVDPGYWAQQLRRPVRFSTALRQLLDGSERVFLEVGPSRTLSTAAMQHRSGDAKPTVVSSCGHPTDDTPAMANVLVALGRLWAAGVPVDWERFRGAEQRRRVRLPTYPFEKQRYWVDPPPLNVRTASPAMATSPMIETPQPSQAAIEMDMTPVPQGPSRRERIQSRIREIFYDLSGVEIADDDGETLFIEMGFDSLFLTQASAELGSEFGEKIRFRQLLEDVSSLDALTSYYDEKLPPEAFAPEPEPTPAPAIPVVPQAASLPGSQPAMAAVGVASMGVPEGATAMERLVAQQLHVMQEQLAMMRGVVTAPVQTAAPSAAQTTPAAPREANDAARPVVQARVEGAPEKKVDKGARFGPYAPVPKGKDGGLTPRQQAHLETLTQRLLAKTRGSRERAEATRAFLADPRSVSGFRTIWKDLVYQIVADRSQGSHLWDIDGNDYVDITMGFGVNFLGHSPEFVRTAVAEQLARGVEIGPQSRLAGEVAAGIAAMTGLERVSFCNTGSEAVMAALRMARTVTGRHRVAYFSGDYHGVFDEVLARSQVVRGELQTLPAAPGILQESVNSSMVLDYGSDASLEILRAQAGELAAVLVEPIQSRHPENRPKEFLAAVREITHKSGTALIFDEVITGFRVHPGGAQAYYGIKADLATYGKVIGGGIPIGVVAGAAAFMDALDGGSWNYGDASAPEADMTFFAGTFVRHPLALAAARAVLAHLNAEGPSLQDRVNNVTAGFARDLNRFFEQRQMPVRIRQFSSWFRFDFPDDVPFANLLVYQLLDRGVYVREAGQNCFFSTQHSEQDVERVKQVVKECTLEMQAAGFLPGGVAEAEGFDPRLAINAGYPLSDSQREIYFASQMGDEASCAYNESFTLKFRGELRVDVLRDAVRRTVARHEALTMRFSGDGPSGPSQRPGEVPQLDLALEDLSGLSDSERANELERIYRTNATTPFDLENGPLIRFRLLQLATDRFYLIGTSHHIVMDGWSAGVLVEEMSELYNAAVSERSADLPEAGSYLQYVLDEEKRRAGSEGQEALDYWVQCFRDLPEPLDLPTDRPHPRFKSHGGNSLHYQFDQEAYESFKQAASREKVTFFVALLAAYDVLLYRLSGQGDVVVGIPSAGQAMAGENSLVGHCVNLLPVRSRLEADTPFRDLLQSTRDAVLDAYDHQDCAFGSILRELRIKRDPSRLPLFEIIFNLDRDIPGRGFEGLEATIHENAKKAAHFDMFLNLNEGEGYLIVDLDYNSDLYDESTMRRWMRHFERILCEAARDPNVAVGEIELLGDEDRQRIEVEWNATTRDYPRDETLHGLFERHVERRPDATALIVPSDGSLAEQRLTYLELDEAAENLARRVVDAGVQVGSRVAIYCDRSAEMIIAILATLKAGAAYVPIDPALPADRIALMLEDSEAELVLTQRGLDPSAAEFAPPRMLVTGKKAANRKVALPEVGADDLAYVIYTSGSTGRPKGVEIEHRAVVNFLSAMADEPGLAKDDRLLAVTTLSFDISILELMLPLSVGACTVVALRDDATNGARLEALIEAHDVTCMQGTPMTWRILLEEGWGGRSGFKALVGGEAFPADLAAPLAERCDQVWNMYGPTETTIWSSCERVLADSNPVTVGRPIANTQLYILDERGRSVPVGVVGELFIGGEGLARGYHGRPELTAERFVVNPLPGAPSPRLYRTGDMARYLADGRVQCLGRMDDQIKLHGFRIELGEIEARLAEANGVEQCAVALRDDGAGGQQLAAYVVPRSGASLEASELRQHLAASLPAYMIPHSYTPLDALPRTPNRKIDRKALPEPDRAAHAGAAHVSPSSPWEEKLASLWAEVLQLDRVSVDANFFDLGGHSVLAIRILARLRREFGVELTIRDLFEFPTVEGLAQQIHASAALEGRMGAPDGEREQVVF